MTANYLFSFRTASICPSWLSGWLSWSWLSISLLGWPAVLSGQTETPLPSSAATSATETAVSDAAVAKIWQFDKAKWRSVLEELTKPLNLILQMPEEPPGSFTYTSERPMTTAAALDLVHGVLLDRGITLIQQEGMLLVVRLGDKVHETLAPFVSRDQLTQLPEAQIVRVELPLNNLSAKQAKENLQDLLSPSGSLAVVSSVNRLLVTDQVRVLRQLLELLAIIDPEKQGQSANLKSFSLQHALAEEVGVVLLEVLGVNEQKTKESRNSMQQMPGMPPFMDYQQMQNDFANRETVESFLPGVSLRGFVPDAPKDRLQTRVAIDRQRNLVVVSGDPGLLDVAARVVTALDQPGKQAGGPGISSQIFKVVDTDAKKLAGQLQLLFPNTTGFSVKGSGDVVVARGTPDQLAQVSRTLARAQGLSQKIALFPVGKRNPEVLTEQLQRLFESLDRNARKPKIVYDPTSAFVVVRGTQEQIEQVRRYMTAVRDEPWLREASRAPESRLKKSETLD